MKGNCRESESLAGNWEAYGPSSRYVNQDKKCQYGKA